MRNHLTSKKRIGTAIGVSIAAAVIVGGATISIAADDNSDGRDPGQRPGAPLDPASAPAAEEPDGSGDGRGEGERPGAVEATSDRVSGSEEPSINGRGGADPAPPLAGDEVAETLVVAGGDVGSDDFDEPRAPNQAADAPVSDDARSAPTDQDVPGLPSGADEPVGALPGEAGSNDQDG